MGATNLEEKGAATKPRGRPPSDARARILTAARVLLAQQRYDAVSVPEIVALAGVAQGTFYRYFAGKGDLIAGMSQQVQAAIEARITQVLARGLPAITILEQLLDAGATVCRDYADILPFLGSEGLLFGTSQRAEVQRLPYLDRLASLVARDQTNGLVRRDILPMHAARLISAILDQVARDLARNPVAENGDSYKVEALGFLKHALFRQRLRPTPRARSNQRVLAKKRVLCQ